MESMHAARLLVGLSLALSITWALSIDPFVPVYILCNTATFSDNSVFAHDLHSTLAALQQESPSARYNSATFGSGINKVNGIYQCRGDVSLDVCAQCVSNASDVALNSCPNAIGSRVQLDGCYLRYENYTFSVPDSSVVVELCNTHKNNSNDFQQDIERILKTVTAAAPRQGGYASSASGNGLYALAQCLGYLSEEDCSSCLSAHPSSWKDCGDAVGAQIHSVDCYYRFEIYPFYYTPAAA